jgi:putative NADPH-quinone reductase
MPSKVLTILGHPRKNSFCAALAAAYRRGALDAGAQVRELLLGDLRFDPLVRVARPEEQPLEEDLRLAQEHILWCDHLVVVYPTWWGTFPALLKGFFDRTFTSGFAFRYRQNSPWWERLLGGRSGHLIATMDAPPLYDRLVNGRPGINGLKKATFHFSGIKPVRVTAFGPVKGSSPARRNAWIHKVEELGRSLR